MCFTLFKYKYLCSGMISRNLFNRVKVAKKVRKVRKKKAIKSKTATIKGKKLTKGKSRYKEGWHLTWDKKKVYLRSGSEFKYAKSLDKKKIGYEVETITIYYFDTKLGRIKKGYPDFYIPSQNLVVEIKGGHLFDLQNLKDRQKAIIAKGYDFQVIVDGKKIKI